MGESWRDQLMKPGYDLKKESDIFSIAHRKIAEKWNIIQVALGLVTTVLSAFAGATIIIKSTNFHFIAGIIALFVTVSSAINTYLKPGELKANHETAHKWYSALSSDIQYYYEIECNRRFNSVQEAQDELGKILQNLVNRMSQLKKDSPMLPSSAVKYAREHSDNS